MSSLPKILFILHLPPPIHGAAMMGKYIHDSQVINEAFDCHYINLATAKDLADIGKVRLNKFVQFFRLLRTIRKEVKRINPQLIYITPNAKGGAFYKDFIVVQMLKLMKCRIVVHYHNKGVSTRQDKPLDNWMYKKFFKKLKVILLAEALYGDIKKYVNRKDVYICPNGIPESQAESLPVQRYNTIPKLLFLSNLLIDKGVFTLLDACKILKDKGYQFICDFVGGETAEISMELLKKEVEIRGLNNYIKYLGRRIGIEKEKCFLHSDIFILPTYYKNECFPVVLLEAMQHKLPCIATREGGIPDIIENGKTGYIIERKNPEMLAEKIIILLNNSNLRTQMGEYGFTQYKQKFTLSKFETCLTQILDDCINNYK